MASVEISVKTVIRLAEKRMAEAYAIIRKRVISYCARRYVKCLTKKSLLQTCREVRDNPPPCCPVHSLVYKLDKLMDVVRTYAAAMHDRQDVIVVDSCEASLLVRNIKA